MDLERKIQGQAQGCEVDGTVLAFAEFVFAHAACGDGPGEWRLDGTTLACSCPWCGEVRLFGAADRAGKREQESEGSLKDADRRNVGRDARHIEEGPGQKTGESLVPAHVLRYLAPEGREGSGREEPAR